MTGKYLEIVHFLELNQLFLNRINIQNLNLMVIDEFFMENSKLGVFLEDEKDDLLINLTIFYEDRVYVSKSKSIRNRI